jgi:hypothetical protein
MKRILDYIDKKNNEFGACHIFSWLSDNSISANDKLCFAPYMAHFVFSFMDINRFILRDLESTDELQKLINIHTDEDSHHWPWYIKDLKSMQFEKKQNFTDSLYFVWGDHSIKSRMITYEMIGLIKQASIKEKVILVEVIEKTGNIFLSHTATICNQTDTLNKNLYFGQHHLNCETGHHMGTKNIEELLAGIVLDEQELVSGIQLVDRTYSLYHDFVDEMYAFAKSNSYQEMVSADMYSSKINTDK